jgi:pyruvate kinase
MLESMIEAASPTRAEVSDVANAIFDGTDAVMLSAETASGRFPVESVRVLTSIATEVESHAALFGHFVASLTEDPNEDRPPVEAVVHAAIDLAERARARWIVVFTLRGQTARLIARYRPRMGIIAMTPHAFTRRRLALAWNTQTLHFPVIRNSHQMLVAGLRLLRRMRLVVPGDRVVIVAGDATLPDASNLLRLVHVKGR